MARWPRFCARKCSTSTPRESLSSLIIARLRRTFKTLVGPIAHSTRHESILETRIVNALPDQTTKEKFYRIYNYMSKQTSPTLVARIPNESRDTHPFINLSDLTVYLLSHLFSIFLSFCLISEYTLAMRLRGSFGDRTHIRRE